MYIFMIIKFGIFNVLIWFGVIYRSVIYLLEFNLKINGILRYIYFVLLVYIVI